MYIALIQTVAARDFYAASAVRWGARYIRARTPTIITASLSGVVCWTDQLRRRRRPQQLYLSPKGAAWVRSNRRPSTDYTFLPLSAHC